MPIEEAQRQTLRGWMEMSGPVTTMRAGGEAGPRARRRGDWPDAARGAWARCCAAASTRWRRAPTSRSCPPSGATGGCSSASTGSPWGACARRSSRSRRRTSCASSSAGITSTAEARCAARPGWPRWSALLEGYEAPAAAWEQELFPSRMRQYVGRVAGAGSPGAARWRGAGSRCATPGRCRGPGAAWWRRSSCLLARLASPVPGLGHLRRRRGLDSSTARGRTHPQREPHLRRPPNLEWLLQAARPERAAGGRAGSVPRRADARQAKRRGRGARAARRVLLRRAGGEPRAGCRPRWRTRCGSCSRTGW